MKKKTYTLAAARVNRGMTQKDVAKILNVTRETISMWETGKVKVTTSTLMALAQIYDVDVKDFSLPEKLA